MLRNYLITTLRNLVHNKLYAVINIVGLAIGFTTAIIIALFVRDELSYDKWIPGYERTYALTETRDVPNRQSPYSVYTNFEFAAQLKLKFSAIERIARMAPALATLRHANREGSDQVYWADPDIFRILPLPVVAGDLATALDQPDAIVITRTLARKYFGRDDPIGESLELGRQHTLVVRAVIDDLPSNTYMRFDAVASGRAAFSVLSEADAGVLPPDDPTPGARIFIRLTPGASPDEMQQALPAFVERYKETIKPEWWRPFTLNLHPIAAMHLHGPADGGTVSSIATLYAASTIGLLIVVVASFNFVNLTTSRSAHRAIEVGVRKVSGAERRDLIVQFIGETIFYVALSMTLAVSLAAMLLPTLNGFLQRDIPFHYWRDPLFAGASLIVVVITGILAGSYPALLLSRFSPSLIFRSAALRTPGLALVRQALVMLQFAILIGLCLVTAVTYRQTVFAMREGLRFNSDKVLVIGDLHPTGQRNSACASSFKDALRRLPVVVAMACSTGDVFEATGSMPAKRPDGTMFNLSVAFIDDGFFDLYGLHAVAGRLLSPNDAGEDFAILPAVVNETAAHKYGFASPAEAIGQIVNAGPKVAKIIGVVPDYSKSVRIQVPPIIYHYMPRAFNLLSVKLAGQQIPETLDAIDRAWARFGDPTPTPRLFLDQDIEIQNRDITMQTRLFSAFAGIAIFISALGLFGLSSFIAESRTKEIGIRKAMGATRADILRLLLWQFAKPVLWANVIAWPVGYFVMRRWLEGFAYHIDLEPWIFLAASALALIIALATVAGHALLVARAKPVAALRYE